MTNDYMLTTIDNPYDPFEQFNQWLLFDKEKGYDSCEKLARIAQYNDNMSQKEIDDERRRAIDLLISLDFTDTFKRAYENKTEQNNNTTG